MQRRMAVLAALLATGCLQRDPPEAPPRRGAAAISVDASIPASEGVDAGPSGAAGGAADGAAPEAVAPARAEPDGIRHVVLISVDGLAPRFLDQMIDRGEAPTFGRLQEEAAWTHNARTDFTHTITLPNHSSMITGLPVLRVEGRPAAQWHGYLDNSTPPPDVTLHQKNPDAGYVESVFDVVHDHGLRTAMFASKPKFVLYTQTYNDAGAPDQVGDDDGRRKVDVSVIDAATAGLTDQLLLEFATSPPSFTFWHIGRPDGEGHGSGWGSQRWREGVVDVDTQIGRLLAAVAGDPALAGRTAILITADHGGEGYGHSVAADENNFTIPFYLWGPGVTPGNLYERVVDGYADPFERSPSYTEALQPIRNGNAANAALALLGLPELEGALMRNPFPPLGDATVAAPPSR